MAYRTADQERWKDFDFVVGQRVCLSPTNHPVADICDELKGEYPKDFKFVGWHPHCRCYVESILKSDKELKEDTRRIIRGEQPTDDSTNAVNDTPPNFDAWVKDNRRRIEHAKTPPYFIRDNRSRIDDILNGSQKAQPAAKRIETPQEVAAERHARRDAAKVQSAWNARRIDRLEELIADGYLPKGVVDPVRTLFAAGNITEANQNIRAINAAIKQQNIIATLSEGEKLLYIQRLKKYYDLIDDASYSEVKFNNKNGGLKATHKGHNFDKRGGQYERIAQNAGFNAGHEVILEEEIHTLHNTKKTDGTWNNYPLEITSSKTATDNNIRNALKHCASKPGCKVAVIVFPNEQPTLKIIYQAIAKYNGLKGTSQWVKFDEIYFVDVNSVILLKI